MTAMTREVKEDVQCEERLAEIRECSDGARLPSGSPLMWRFLNWLYARTGHEANPPEWIEEQR